ncbi:MAG TPA: cbb3-type cytochrome oxidase assembly protein CcoS [Chromatiaceae bacterium]|nr:cbb3-type cytochrome oxidase assembly protein CcoS [Chromatiaceae bacterium]
MEVIYSLIPGMIFFGLLFVAVLFWAIRKGQYDDLEGDGQRILLDKDEEPSKGKTEKRMPGERQKRVGLNYPDED